VTVCLEWIVRFADVAQMMFHLARHLKALHENGYAHRDLKPGNVMWQPSRNLWTLIDFGCAARIGTMHDLTLTVAYAAPEVVAEYRKGSQTILVNEAVDAWSLGVVSFELLTGEPAAKMWVGKEKVWRIFLFPCTYNLCS
jgi:serine/threonine protein kinase